MMFLRTPEAALTATVLAAAFAVAVATPAGNIRRTSGGSPPTQPILQAENPIKLNVALVNVLVTVLDKNHEVLTNLKQNDFRIFENSREQRIAVFSKGTKGPVTEALLMDTSLSERYMIATEREAASKFVHEVMSDEDEGMVIGFDSDVGLLADLTEETAVLDGAIARTVVGPPVGNAGTVLYDAIYLACDRLRNEAGRKLLVVFTDGDDYGSRMKFEEAIAVAQRMNVSIFVGLIADPRFSSGYGFGIRGETVAKIMSNRTGGREVEIRTRANLAKAIDELSAEIRSQYALGYYPTNTKLDGRFRKITVKTTARGTTILARRGYFAPARSN